MGSNVKIASLLGYPETGYISLLETVEIFKVATDMLITGDLTVNTDIILAGSFVLEDQLILDADNAEALLIRKNGDFGDIFTVDSVGSQIKLLASGVFGSAATPTLALGDGDSGLFESADDLVGLVGGGTEIARLSNGGTSNLTQFIISPGANHGTETTPALAFGNGSDGIDNPSAGALNFNVGGDAKFQLMSNAFYVLGSSGGAYIYKRSPTSTNPVFTFESDTNTGIGRADVGQLSLIAGGVELLRLIEGGTNYLQIPNNTYLQAVDNAGTGVVDMCKVNTSDELEFGSDLLVGQISLVEDGGVQGLLDISVTATPAAGTEEGYTFGIDSDEVLRISAEADSAGSVDWHRVKCSYLLDRGCTATITASTTQTQLQQLLVAELNEVSVCANANDVVTLPPAVAGRTITIINNGAETLQIFPYTDDAIGAGAADASTTLAAAGILRLIAYNNINWVDIT